MAKFLGSSKSSLRKTYRGHKRNIFICGVICLISATIFMKHSNPLGLILTISLCSIFVLNQNKKSLIVKAGLIGEEYSSKVLKKLPNSYYVIPNLKLQIEGGMSEMDHVVIGENGIFVIESKNHKGIIKGKESDQRFTQVKKGRGGEDYSKTFYNPIKQVNTHVYRVAKVLKKNGYRYWVQGAVLFTNSEVKVDVRSGSVPVFSMTPGRELSMINYLKGYNGKDVLSAKECKAVAETLYRSRVK